MAERLKRQEFQISLVDRLTDMAPKDKAETPLTPAQAVRVLKAGLRRDLEWLLNSRRRIGEPPEGAQQLPASLYLFGLPDMSGRQVGIHRQQDELAREIERAIAIFEPRLRNVSVKAFDATSVSRTLRFQIDGLLRIDPGTERISFDTTLELASGSYRVEARGA
jgi:type VI secretion system protein ImpF